MSGKLITNQETTLASIINDALPNCADVRFLIGYFYYSGFRELYKGLADKNLKILYGLDIDIDLLKGIREIEELDYQRVSKSEDQKQQWEKIVKLFDTNRMDTKDSVESFRLFCDKIKQGTLQIRKTKDPNHAKMYLFEAKDSDKFGNTLPGHMIIGSSNLSGAGLRTQHELNVIFHGEEYNQGKEYFDTLWDSATPIADVDIWEEFRKNVVEKIWIDKLPSPYLVYLRVLEEYFSTTAPQDFKTPYEITKDNRLPDGKVYNDFAYQTDAIIEGINRLKRHNGVIIADVVGLGKSIIASAIAANMNMPVIVIAPPHLKTQWEDYCKDFHIQHNSHVFSSGKISEVADKFANDEQPFLLIVDEAHKYRNKNKDYDNLYRLSKGGYNKVMLLTATPYSNKPDDIYNLIRLFQIPEKTTLRNINNLGGQFEELIREYNKAYKEARDNKNNKAVQETFDDLVKKIAKRIQHIITPVVIRRSRKDLEASSKYKKDLAKQNIKFSKVRDPEIISYDLGDLEEKYINTLDVIYPKDFDEEESPRSIKDGVYKAARYQPLKYAKEPAKDKIIRAMSDEEAEWVFLEGSQSNLANFMRRLLVHRFESSIASFKASLQSLRNNSRTILNWIEVRHTIPVYKRGYLPDIKALKEDSEDKDMTSLLDGIDQVEMKVSELKAKGLVELDMDWIKPEFISDVKQDAEILDKIYKDWFGDKGNITDDPKYDTFINKINKMLKEEPNRKIVIFSEFADTVKYLYSRLKKDGLPVFCYSSDIANTVNKKAIIENFDAGLPVNQQKDFYKILVATDAISEGYNLHRAGTIFNYDIPYNPTRVIQRIGRINRINKKVFDELYIYNYFPSEVGASNVNLQRITTIKMRMIHAIMGGDTKILDKTEKLTLSKFNNEFNKAKEESEELSWDTKYREEWENTKKLFEYQEALAINPRTKIQRTKSNGHPGIIVFGKRGGECVFKWQQPYDEAPEYISPEEAIPLFEASKNEKSIAVSESFYNVYQNIKDNLFTTQKAKVSTPRVKALSKVRAMLNSNDEQCDKEYLELLFKVLELDGLPDLSPINKAKDCKKLKESISIEILLHILKSADKIDKEPENVILAEEMI